jgi:phage terminase small subunit
MAAAQNTDGGAGAPRGTLTAKQEAFALAYVETGNASESYRRAYDVRPGTKESTINRTAKEIVDNPKVAARIAELRAPAAEKAQLTLDKHLDDLMRLRNMAVKDGKWSAAINAEIARGKAAGLYVERTELTGKDGAPIPVTNVPVAAYLKARAEVLKDF